MEILKQLLFSSFMFLIYLNSVESCSCDWEGNFLLVSDQNIDLIVYGIVDEYIVDTTYIEEIGIRSNHRDGFYIKIIDVIQGHEHSDKIAIFGDNGMLCRDSAYDYEKGNHYIFSINELSNTEDYGSKIHNSINKYYISACGEFSLSYSVVDGYVKGRIVNRNTKKCRKLPFNKLVRRLKRRNDL